MKSIDKKQKALRSLYFIAGFLIVSAFILSTGYLYYRYTIKSFRVQIDQELSAIADMKVKEIIQWREERLGDVSIFYKNDLFSSLVQRYFEKPDDAETLKRIQNWLGKVQKHNSYEKVFLMDANGVERFSIPKATTPVASFISREHFEVMKSKQIIFGDFYRNEHDHKIYLDVLAPIIDAQDSSRVLGILGLQIDPEHYLYPLISSWPTPSKTSETLILRREGDEIVFLNDLKFQKNAALTLRAPMNGIKAIPAIKAALGEEGIVEAPDYRGEPVIAAIRTIHGSPWFMVARMDQAEAFAPLRERLWILIILVGLLLSGIAAGFVMWRNRQRKQFLNYKLEIAHKDYETQQRLVSHTLNSPMAVIEWDSDFIVTLWSGAAQKIFGWSAAKTVGKPMMDLNMIYEEDILQVQETMAKFTDIDSKFIVSATRNYTKDGKVIYCEWYNSVLLDEKGNLISVMSLVLDITGRKQMTDQLNEQKTIVEFILDQTIAGYWDWDIPTGKFFMSPAFKKMFGYEEDELPNTFSVLQEIMLPEDLGKILELFQQHVSNKGQVAFSMEVRYWHKDGSIKWVICSGKIISWDKDGNPLRVVGSHVDITERKNAEAELLLSRDILQNNIDSLFIFDQVTRQFSEVNEMACRTLGYTRKEMLTMRIDDIDPVFPLDQWPAHVELVKASKEGLTFETVHIRKDGTQIPVEVITRYVPLGGNNCMVATTRDITERKKTEEEIQKLSQAVEQAPTVIFITDKDGNIEYTNPLFTEVTGYSFEEVKGKNPRILKTDYYPQSFYQEMWATITSGKVWKGDFLNKKKNGEIYWESTSISPIFSSDGNITHFVAVKIDISFRKRIEEELKQAKTEAERANLAKSEFLSRMSHELRTPMNSILGFAQLMDMGELKPAHKKGVGHILKSGKHLLDLINEVLELSRIEAGKLSISLESVQLRGIILETMDILRPLATERNLALNLSDSPVNDLFAEADRQRLKQVLLNLTSNAVKYNRDGGSVQVECELLHPENEPMVRISITDTGNGISPEGVTKLFTPFERVDADKTETEGTGLGLTIAKKMIEAMHGTIGVESEVGAGSTFWIGLPLIEGQPDRHERLSDQVAPEPEKAVVSGTILYIEDNISNIQLVEHILEEHRPRVRLISEMYGKNAVKLATEFKPDLILLDLDLPDIHGSEVLKLLQAKSKTSAISVVILSADAMGHSVEQLMKAGAKNYLTKPLDVLEFLRVWDDVMGENIQI